MPDKSISPRLPPELVLRVFEHSPKATIIVCSIVCNQWRDMSMSYRFNDLVIHCDPTSPNNAPEQDSDDSNSLDDDVNDDERQASGGARRKLLSHFLQFLQQSSRVAEKIHHLTVVVHPDFHTPVPSPNTDHDSFVGILCTLPQLRTLTLKDVLLPELGHESDVLTDAKLDRLTVCYPLIHYYGRLVELHQLLGMVQLFGKVDELFFEHVWFGSSTTSHFPLQLDVASLDLRKVWNFTSLLRSIQHSQRMDPSNTNLRRVDFRCIHIDPGHIPEMNSFLDLTGPQLLELRCSMPNKLDIGKHREIGASLFLG